MMVAAPGSPAGFWKRSVAYSLDVIALSLVFQLVLSVGIAAFAGHDIAWLLGLLERAQALQESGDLDGVRQLWAELGPWLWRATWVSTLVYALIGAVYFAGMEASPWHATLGKRLLGIHVVTGNGRPIGLGRALLRYFAAGVSWVFLNLGHAMAAWTPDKRALHDYVADTRVENVDPANTAMPLWGWVLIGIQVGVVLLFAVACGLAVAIAVSRMGQI